MHAIFITLYDSEFGLRQDAAYLEEDEDEEKGEEDDKDKLEDGDFDDDDDVDDVEVEDNVDVEVEYADDSDIADADTEAVAAGRTVPKNPASWRYWGSWVVLPEPVSPTIMSIWLACMAARKASRRAKTGRLSRIKDK